MKVVILAGGKGSRINEESRIKPKPMIEIGDVPIIVHIIRIYAAQGFNDFLVCAGYKQQLIKEYFVNFDFYSRDALFHIGSPRAPEFLSFPKDRFDVSVVDTGLNTNTAGRVRRVRELIGDERFMLTYGDAVSDIDLKALLRCHESSGKIATITAYNFGQSKGVLDLESDGSVKAFREKSDYDGDLINAGFMVLEPTVFDYIQSDEESFENGPLARLAAEGQLAAHVHHGFWQCMDTLSEKNYLEKLWESGKAPWKLWKD